MLRELAGNVIVWHDLLSPQRHDDEKWFKAPVACFWAGRETLSDSYQMI